MSVLSNLRATLLMQAAAVMTTDLGGPLYTVERGFFLASDPPEVIADTMAQMAVRDLTGQLSTCDATAAPRSGQTGHSGPTGPSTRHIVTNWAFAYAIGSERENAETGSREVIDSAAFERWMLSINYRLLTGLQSPGPPTGWSYWYPEMTVTVSQRTPSIFVRVIYFTVRCDSTCT